MAQIIEMKTWKPRDRKRPQRRAASSGRWLIEETCPGCRGWRPVQILRGEEEDEELVPMEPEDWPEALERYRRIGFITLESDTYRLRNVCTGKIIPEGVIPLAPELLRLLDR